MREKKPNSDLPLGFGMALAQNSRALERFAALEPAQRRELAEQARQIGSREEMQAFISARLG